MISELNTGGPGRRQACGRLGHCRAACDGAFRSSRAPCQSSHGMVIGGQGPFPILSRSPCSTEGIKPLVPGSPLPGLGCKSTSKRAGVGMQPVSLCPSFTGGSGQSPAQRLCSSQLSGLPVLRKQPAFLHPCREQPTLLNLRHPPELPASLQ